MVRPVIFWIHLVCGVVAGVVVLVMSATGVALTYERQLEAWADRRALAAAPDATGSASLSLDTLVARARTRVRGASASGLTVRADPTAPVAVTFGRDVMLYVDRPTGAVLGEGAPRVRRALAAVTSWHRWLGREGDGRRVARAVTGASNLAFLGLVLTGIYLWIPRRWTWRHVRALAWFRGGLSPKARDFNWHHVIGLWAWVPLVVIVASGVVMSYGWANRLVYRAFGERPPAQSAGPGGAGPAPTAAQPASGGVGLDALVALGTARVPAWRTMQIQLPRPAARQVTVSVDAGTGGQPQRRSQLVVDRASGRVVRWEPFATQSPGRRARSFLRFAHTGEVLGIVGQTIAGLASLGATVLVWTGLALAFRRLARWRARRAGASTDTSELRDADPAAA
ncbi:PepSY-associated TM helix domain-containing protein [Gemmatirosa kalamazoonensis]|uniref:PepSY-associated TM helix domain-containing protein n=1 Tax=Gemmatirosa kalamazoonensis TaxID=861299 RepID=W0RQA9_9BACT|nr:PepSY-associated TM helix domain-containing protein [Gemmatirosa kalamazoonensis]AHG91688.1 PepSY-associated TM helix domain-containing protein [Gemmatirosa kalamazoonensis]